MMSLGPRETSLPVVRSKGHGRVSSAIRRLRPKLTKDALSCCGFSRIVTSNLDDTQQFPESICSLWVWRSSNWDGLRDESRIAQVDTGSRE